jgi:hypothetical protein
MEEFVCILVESLARRLLQVRREVKVVVSGNGRDVSQIAGQMR